MASGGKGSSRVSLEPREMDGVRVAHRRCWNEFEKVVEGSRPSSSGGLCFGQARRIGVSRARESGASGAGSRARARLMALSGARFVLMRRNEFGVRSNGLRRGSERDDRQMAAMARSRHCWI